MGTQRRLPVAECKPSAGQRVEGDRRPREERADARPRTVDRAPFSCDAAGALDDHLELYRDAVVDDEGRRVRAGGMTHDGPGTGRVLQVTGEVESGDRDVGTGEDRLDEGLDVEVGVG